mmetsp:Transcript_16218/g.42689  ORF Transcript_16218/g.42689 Transcript_16218/m.42689 type:complete len:131 (-) Transcript_16218:392-784(-)
MPPPQVGGGSLRCPPLRQRSFLFARFCLHVLTFLFPRLEAASGTGLRRAMLSHALGGSIGAERQGVIFASGPSTLKVLTLPLLPLLLTLQVSPAQSRSNSNDEPPPSSRLEGLYPCVVLSGCLSPRAVAN